MEMSSINIKRFLLIMVALLLTALVFASGVFVGNTYNLTDFLCPVTATPHILKREFISESGIVFPEGTIVPLRECAYMQRFTFRFAMDNSVETEPYLGPVKDAYGFAELRERVETP